MTLDTNSFHAAHDELRERTQLLVDAARRLPDLEPEERDRLIYECREFLHLEVVPHTRIDDLVLFPEVAIRLRDPFVTGSMSYDHRAIRAWSAELDRLDPNDVPHVQEALYGLHALIRVHLWKEDELYLKLVDSAAWPVVGPGSEPPSLTRAA